MLKTLTLLVLILAPILIPAQCPHYTQLLREGDAKFTASDFRGAINKYQAAITDCPERAGEVQPKVIRVFDMIDQLRKEAEEDREIARIAQMEAAYEATRAEIGELKADSARQQVELQNLKMQLLMVLRDEEIEKNIKLINAFYFFDGKFALAYGTILGNENFYFIDKSGNRVDRLGIWEKAEQFDSRGLAKVTDGINTLLLDTLGKLYPLSTTVSHISNINPALQIEGVHLKTISLSIFRHTPLRVLLLGNNEISELSPKVGNLSNLWKLDLSNNRLRSIPNEIGKLISLTSLDIESNKLNALPADIETLTQLQNLKLAHNQLISLPAGIGNCSKLLYIFVGDNRLTALPSEIGDLSSLISLDLQRNQLTTLPPEIGKLSSLSFLSLSENQLTTLPPQIGNLSSLTSLGLSYNDLTELPSQIENLSALTSLYLSHNKLTALPPEIGNLSGLTVIYLMGNQLTTLPPEIGNLTSLLSLDLSENQLAALSPEIANLKTLRILSIGNNPCSDTPEKQAAILKQMHEWLPNCKVIF